MNLIQIILHLRGKPTEEREKFYHEAGVLRVFRIHIDASFDDNGNLVDLDGRSIPLHLSTQVFAQ